MSLTALFYVLVYFFGLFKALLGKPIFGLYAYFFAFYLHAPSRWWGKGLPDVRWSLLAAAVTLVAIFLRPRSEKKIWFNFVENKLFFMFVIYIVFQTIWALNLDIHLEYVFLVLKFSILIFIIQNSIRSEKDLVGVLVVNLLGVCYFTFLGMTSHSGGRLEGIGTSGLESANQLGQHMATVLTFSAYLLLCDFGKKKYLLILPIVIALNGVLLTESRGVILSLAVVGLCSLLVVPAMAKKQYAFYAIMGSLAGVVLIGPQIIERFDSMRGLGESGEQDSSAASRMVIINAQIDMFLERPLLGHGHKGTVLLSNQFIPDKYLTTSGGGQARRASHNFLFALLVDHGLIGTSLYLMIIFSCTRKVWHIHRSSKDNDDSRVLVVVIIGLGLALVCFMVAGMGSNNKKLEIDIWLYAMIALVYGKIVQSRLERKFGASSKSQEGIENS